MTSKFKTHNLKIDPEYFRHVLEGKKTFEIRKNDRDFHCGDQVILQEFCRDRQQYSGKEIKVEITFMLLEAPAMLQPGYCIFSFVPKEFIRHFSIQKIGDGL